MRSVNNYRPRSHVKVEISARVIHGSRLEQHGDIYRNSHDKSDYYLVLVYGEFLFLTQLKFVDMIWGRGPSADVLTFLVSIFPQLALLVFFFFSLFALFLPISFNQYFQLFPLREDIEKKLECYSIICCAIFYSNVSST